MTINERVSGERIAALLDCVEMCEDMSIGENAEMASALRELQQYRAAAEPVADVVEWSHPGEERRCDIRWRRHDVAPGPLYAAPQFTNVPDEMPKGLAGQIVSLMAHNIGDKFLAQKIWNACRAAMLNSAPAVQADQHKHQAIPAGYALVPIEPTEHMVIAGFEAELHEEVRDPESWEVFEAMSGCEQAAMRARWCWAAMVKAAQPQEQG